MNRFLLRIVERYLGPKVSATVVGSLFATLTINESQLDAAIGQVQDAWTTGGPLQALQVIIGLILAWYVYLARKADPKAPTEIIETPIQPIQTTTTQNRERSWSTRSRQIRETLHPDLQRVCDRALEISRWDFALISGRRTLEEQKVLLAAGKTETLNSGHVADPSIAVDIQVYGPDGKTWEPTYYTDVRQAFTAAAKELRVPMRRLIQLQSGPDLGHQELDRTAYPDIDVGILT